MFKQVNNVIPGRDISAQIRFINQSFEAIENWMNNLLKSHELTPERIVNRLKKYVDISNHKLHHVAAFLDTTTNYYAHTGVQTVANTLITQASKNKI